MFLDHIMVLHFYKLRHTTTTLCDDDSVEAVDR